MKFAPKYENFVVLNYAQLAEGFHYPVAYISYTNVHFRMNDKCEIISCFIISNQMFYNIQNRFVENWFLLLSSTVQSLVGRSFGSYQTFFMDFTLLMATYNGAVSNMTPIALCLRYFDSLYLLY